MSYYILKQDPRIPEQAHVMSCPEGLNPDVWYDGGELPEPGLLRFKMTPSSGEFRGVIIGGILPFFHQVFVEELDRLGIDNLQFFPVELEAPDGMIETKYSLVNVIDLVEAVDEEKSVIKPRAHGGRGQLYSFVIDPEKAAGRKLFRLAEAPTLIIVDSTLHEALLEFRPPALMMLPTDRYDGWS